MNNRRGMMTSLLAVGAAGAAIYGITRGVRNGTFQRLPQTLSNAMNNQAVQQIAKPLQNMATNQNIQPLANNLQSGTNNAQQQVGNNN
ncbi:hypothetical protein J2Z83_001277 [Virgibacillus natechei]|uniref:YtxH domain-containing protein n=2 Tax=Virgibacillus natechei TaxID=1216297 RepID=A0ABS4IGM7_9BACI|nr:hypothetical protein [Virgibacillus natechei]